MKKAHEPRSRPRVCPDDVLSGRVQASAAEIFALIHEVNPTGHQMSSEERARRYQLKARLQSALLRRFPEEVWVRPDPQRPGFLLLDRAAHAAVHAQAPGPRDGCHALLESLEEDIRAAVQRRLDLQDDAASHALPDTLNLARPARAARLARRGAAEAHDDVERGQAALEAYDYDAAREHLYAALSAPRPQERERGARLLVILLVEHLAADREALALRPRLPDSVAERPDVRLALGLAAARCGDAALALSLSEGLTVAAAAAIPRQLGAAALREGRLEDAQRCLDQARGLDPLDREQLRLEDALAEARARARAPLEQEVERLLLAGDVAAAEGEARAVLGRFPDSEVARRALRIAGEHRRAREARDLLQQADAAAAAGELAQAGEILLRARRLGPPADLLSVLVARAAALEEQVRAQQAAARIQGVRFRLREGDLAGAVRLWLDLPATLRDAAEDECGAFAPPQRWDLFEELDRLRPGASGQRIIEAVSALVEAEALAATAPDRALSLLGLHDRLLSVLPLARRLQHDLQRAIKDRDQRSKAALLLQLRQAVEASALEEAKELLNEMRRLSGAPEQEAEQQRLAEALVGKERYTLLARRVNALPPTLYDTMMSLEMVDEIIAMGRPSTAAWIENRRERLSMLRQCLRLRVLDGPGLEHELCDVALSERPTAIWRLPGEDGAPAQVVLCDIYGQILLLRFARAEPGRLQVLRRVVVPGLNHMRECELVVERRHVTLISAGLAVLRLTLPELDVVVAIPVQHQARECTAMLVPGTDRVWVRWGGAGVSVGATVYQLRSNQLHCVERRTARSLLTQAVLGEGEPPVFNQDYTEGTLNLHRAQGGVRYSHKVPRGLRPAAPVLAHPSGPGWLVPTRGGDRFDGSPGELPLFCVQVGERGGVGAPRPIAPRAEGQLLVLRAGATAREAGVSWLHLADRVLGGREELLALSPGAGAAGVVELHRVEVPAGTTLVTDVQSRRVLALSMVEGGLEAVELGRERPTFEGHTDRCVMDRLYDTTSCGLHGFMHQRRGSLHERRDIDVINELSDLVRDRAACRARFDNKGDDIYEMVRMTNSIASPLTSAAHELVKVTLTQHPDHLGLLLLCAEIDLGKRNLAAARRSLEALRDREMPARAAAHLLHMWAVLALGEGRFEEAHELVQGCLSRGVMACDVEFLLPLCEPRSAPCEAALLLGEGPPLRRLLWAIELSDARLDAGDYVGAARLLDRRVVWQQGELQSFGRLCTAALDRPVNGDMERLRQEMIVARYVSLHDRGAVEVPLQGGAWSRARLDELAQRAAEWVPRELGQTLVPKAAAVATAADVAAQVAAEAAAEAAAAAAASAAEWGDIEPGALDDAPASSG